MAPKSSDKNGGKKANDKSNKAAAPKSKSSRSKDKTTSVPMVLSAVVAFVAFIGGLLTPSVRHLIGELMVDR